MSKHHKLQDLMVSALFGEADPVAMRELEEALAADEELAREYNELQETLGVVSEARLAEDPGPEFWRKVWPEFQRREREERTANSRREKAPAVWNWRPALQIVIVAAMLIIGIFIGRIISEQRIEDSGARYEADETPITLPYEREIEESKRDYFFEVADSSLERSSTLISNFMDLDPQEWSSNNELVSRSRAAGSEILSEISLLRESINDPRFIEIEPIFNELELFVGEIAGIEGGEDDIWFEIEALQRGIQDRNLLDRLNQLRTRVVSLRDARKTNPMLWIER
ncbi:MAG TPA: hypothetical protein VMX35_02450 [Acidobacteriota bacterium]|nr:hypothetical protein [Acidobacteriota bacterium]